MARVGPLETRFAITGGQGAALSLRSVAEVLAAARGVPQRLVQAFPDFFDTELSGGLPNLRLDAGNLFSAEPIDTAALRAGELILHTSDRYVELVTAIAGDRDIPLNFDPHGWPILSLEGSSSAVDGPESIA